MHGRIVDFYKYKMISSVRNSLARYNDPTFLEADLEIWSMYILVPTEIIGKGKTPKAKKSLSGSGTLFILISGRF